MAFHNQRVIRGKNMNISALTALLRNGGVLQDKRSGLIALLKSAFRQPIFVQHI